MAPTVPVRAARACQRRQDRAWDAAATPVPSAPAPALALLEVAAAEEAEAPRTGREEETVERMFHIPLIF